MSVVIRLAEEKDIASIQGLLEGAGVNSGGVAENIGQFLVVEQEGEDEWNPVGTVGLELYEEGRYGVMRSLVMRTQAWSAEVGVELIRLFLAYAETTGIEALYLLTQSTAPTLFIHMGFSTAVPEQIPSAIATSPHFAAYENEQVIAMVKTFTSTTYPQGNVDNVHN
ncbi:MAG: GNAT family N-acetyltransferase [Tumebacillaceae bacterium]